MATNKVPENLKQRLKESYDAIAPKYNEWTILHSQYRLYYLDKLLNLLNATEKSQVSTLELGCGCGIPVTQKLLSHETYHVTANDLSSTQLEAARENLHSDAAGDRLRLVPGDMTELSFAAGSLDAVIGMYSLIHLPSSEQVLMIEKIVGWLKPGGYMLANFTEETIGGVVNEKWLDDKGWVYWSGLGAENTVQVIKDTSLNVVVSKVTKDIVDASFLWVLAKKGLQL
ncbi:uncharacterized protein JN550_011471 [Neoarthrinium moseri]|uniref:uncharacterized protein n=1 Tax=Neoarthrinium moseri TaxID=1658444 RepID=UPI001FDCC6ED|nr:uncharacterized protein JN550_011471 [Neoarthrinium moseri]KAI1860623.1 hypothetical protein JN550_011471 [Neoarthrinium moseri]